MSPTLLIISTLVWRPSMWGQLFCCFCCVGGSSLVWLRSCAHECFFTLLSWVWYLPFRFSGIPVAVDEDAARDGCSHNAIDVFTVLPLTAGPGPKLDRRRGRGRVARRSGAGVRVCSYAVGTGAGARTVRKEPGGSACHGGRLRKTTPGSGDF